MSRNLTSTHLDTDQIMKKKFDETYDADRVVLVGGDKIELTVDSNKIASAIGDSITSTLGSINFGNFGKASSVAEKNIFIPQVEIKTIEIPTIIKEIEYREIEKIVYVPQIEYKTIEIPVISERIITVDRPIVIEKVREVPKWQKICFIIQTIAVIGLFISHLTK